MREHAGRPVPADPGLLDAHVEHSAHAEERLRCEDPPPEAAPEAAVLGPFPRQIEDARDLRAVTPVGVLAGDVGHLHQSLPEQVAQSSCLGHPLHDARDHRVPVCWRAREVLHAAGTLGGSRLVFSARDDKLLDDKRVRRLLRELRTPAVPHGFRSSFREWAAEETDHPREVVKAASAAMQPVSRSGVTPADVRHRP